MRSAILLLFSLLSFSISQAQSTAQRAYRIFQDKCVECHSNANPEAGLDLQGAGTTEAQRMLNVRSNIIRVTPNNPASAARGDQYVYPGRVDRSLLFRKINRGMDPTLSLDEEENQPMPPVGAPQLTDTEKELIRQWILYGAPHTGTVVEEALLNDYYSGAAQQSFPDGPPPAPAPGEGFQIKMGPFYLPPGGEAEYFQKYELELPADVEVARLEVMMGTFSHHFILYDFNEGGSDNIRDGLRINSDHSDIGLVAAVQESQDLRLPEGTAFVWEEGLVLDLNSHYINYSAANAYQAEAYINVYTQPTGTAAQEMKTELIANTNIPIPNTGSPVTHSQQLTFNLGEVFVWGLMGHTHKYGTGYKIFKRRPGGQRGELIYDAACPQGIPGCISPFFDYQHIPMRYFQPLEPVTFNILNGLIHEASWVNDGPQSVGWGPTSNDEMMVMIVMYTEDTTGIVNTSLQQVAPIPGVQVFPNPAGEAISFAVPAGVSIAHLWLLDATGQTVLQRSALPSSQFTIERGNLPGGMYFYQLEDERGRRKAGKLILK